MKEACLSKYSKKKASHFGMNWWNGMGTLCNIPTIYARIVDD